MLTLSTCTIHFPQKLNSIHFTGSLNMTITQEKSVNDVHIVKEI